MMCYVHWWDEENESTCVLSDYWRSDKEASPLQDEENVGNDSSEKDHVGFVSFSTLDVVVAEVIKNDKTIKNPVFLIYETVLLTFGFNLNNPNKFCSRIHKMLKLGLNINEDISTELNSPISPLKEGGIQEKRKMMEMEAMESQIL
ncbi:hypothetical protein SUGI_0672520 [Cryptomeria japonica]|nr:hypothetical protein SUGI_0672520 [Cryptomeria japonica]